MHAFSDIPAYSLYGEDDPFPDVLHCESFAARAPIYGWQIAPHRHGQIAQMFVLRAGAVTAVVDGRRYQLQAGMFLFVPMGCVHSFAFQPDSDGAVLSFPVALLRSIAPQTAGLVAALSQPVATMMPAAVSDIAQHLQRLTARPMPYRAQVLVGLAQGLLALIAQLQTAGPRPASARLQEYDMLIAANMAKGWTVADYARAMAISAGQLGRICRAASGQSAGTYLEQHLMVEACRMLAFTLFPVSEIGYRLGYGDPSYFSKRFRAVRNTTPSAYRAQFSG